MSEHNINGKIVGIQQFRNDWALALMTKGIIIKLSVSKWSGISSLKYSDLGIKFKNDEASNMMRKYISLGHERLIPPEMISQIIAIEVRARTILANNSFDTVWGKFVPFTAFSQWEHENNQIKQDFILATKKFIERYDEIIFTVRKEYRDIAKDVWARLYPESTGAAPESFIEDYVSKVIAKIPSKLDMEKAFNYTTTFFQIPLPSFIEEDLKLKEKITQERDQQLTSHKLEIEAKIKISEEYTKRKQEYIDEFLNSTVNSMRIYIADFCGGILENIYKSEREVGDVPKQQRDKIKTLIKKINLLNFHNDSEINKLSKELEIEVNKFKGERNKDIITEKLQKLIEIKNIDFVPTDYNPIISGLEL